ncbi:MAG: hypothetical protein V4622_01675 [Bacteroidota bacterium]
MKKIHFIILVFPILFFSCNKTLQEKKLKKWIGKWEIVGVSDDQGDIYNESNPFGTITFFEDGSGELRIKNYDYSDVDMGLVMEFFVKPDNGSFVYIYGVLLKETNPGFEDEKSNLPCEQGETAFFSKRGFFNAKKKNVSMKINSYPVCKFGSGEWIINKIK